jgi:hypothetical protein
MSDKDSLDREPIELVEIVLPRCINTYGVAPCTASGGTGSECFNCRATCQDVDNYRDTPDRHLTPDLILTQGDDVGSGAVTRSADIFAAFEVWFSATPSGVIWEQGGAANGSYLGVDSGNLVFEVFSSNTGTISVDASQFAGKTMFLYVEIDFVASTSADMILWAFDPVELSLTQLGTASLVPGGQWAGNGVGGIGFTSGATIGGRDDTDWSGTVSTARFYDSQTAPADMSDNFAASLWLGKGVKGEPVDEKYILPCLQDVGTIGTRINLSASDDNYEPLGRRATMSFTASDFTHSDITQDPYVATRPYNPKERSTFWRKWLARQKFGKVGALVRRHVGYAGQPLSAYERQAFILDKATWIEDGVDFYCRDILSRTEFRKAQIPAPSGASLNAAITDTDVSFTVDDDVTADYPASGTVRINDEIMTYTAIAAAGAPVVTTFSGLTRGTDGSTAEAHDIDDLVQVCRRYTSADIDDVLREWLIEDSRIEGQFVNMDEIEDEVAAYLGAYSITTLLTEPTGVDQLVGRLSAECSFFVWWDERDQQIRFRAIRAVSSGDVVANLSYGDNIIADRFQLTEKPKERLNVIAFYYNPIDFSGDLDKATNFKNGLKVVNGTTSLPEQYGNLIQSRDIYSIFLTTEAEANQTSSRLAVRYADIPVYAEMYVDAKDREIWVGDVVTVEHPTLVDATGTPLDRRWLVIEAEEVDPGHIVRYVCADITLDGIIYRITENGIGTYTAELFAAGNAFITDNAGLNADGSTGATIN